MAKIERAGAHLEEQWRHQHEVVATHEHDFDVAAALAKPLEVPGRGHAAKSAAEDYDGRLHSVTLRTDNNRAVNTLGPSRDSIVLIYRREYRAQGHEAGLRRREIDRIKRMATNEKGTHEQTRSAHCCSPL